jgi:hypothetical protein
MANRLEELKPDARLAALRKEWVKVLGDIEPPVTPKLIEGETEEVTGDTLHRFALEVEPGIVVPFLLLAPKGAKEKAPAVVMVGQGGKAGFLKERGDVITVFLKAGMAVCLVDVRGTGESQPADGSPGRTSSRTSISQTNLILGQPVFGSQLRDLRAVIRWLQRHKGIDGKKLSLWGDSFAKVNAKDARFMVPLDAPELPHYAEPVGAQLALLAALYEEGVKLTYARGGTMLSGDLRESAYVYLPHSAILPHDIILGSLTQKTLNEMQRAEKRFAGVIPFDEVDSWNCWRFEEVPTPPVMAKVVAELLRGK